MAALVLLAVIVDLVGIIVGAVVFGVTRSVGGLNPLLVFLFIGIVEIFNIESYRRMLPLHSAALVQDVNRILDSTATVGDPSE